MESNFEWATTSLRTILWKEEEEGDTDHIPEVTKEPHQTEEYKAAKALQKFIVVCLSTRLGGAGVRGMRSWTSNATTFIGEGVDYFVETARYPRTSKTVVIKSIKPSVVHGISGEPIHRTNARRINTVLKEVRILSHEPLAKAANIISLFLYGWDEYAPNASTPCLVVEYAEYGNMRDYLVSRSGDRPDQRTTLCLDILKGLHALHACDIVHGDVKLENMLVFKDDRGVAYAKVADFGSAIILNDPDQSFIYLGTPLYNPPEIRALEDQQTGCPMEKESLKACDVYSFGLLVWETCHDGTRYLRKWLTEQVLKGKLVDLRRLAIRRAHAKILHLPEKDRHAIETCLQMCLAPQSRHRRSLSELVEAFGTTFGASESPQPEDWYPLSIGAIRAGYLFDLGNSGDLFGLLTGYTPASHYMLRVPWSVQRDIAGAYQLNATNKDPLLAAPCLMGLAIFHYCGFGVARDMDAVLKYAREAARQGSQEMPAFLPQLEANLSAESIAVHSVLPLTDREQRYYAGLVAATKNEPYCTPFTMVARSGLWMMWHALPDYETLHSHALQGWLGGVRGLFQRGLRDSQDEYGQTALLMGCRGGCLPVVRELLAWGSDASLADARGFTPLHYLIFFPDDDVASAAQLLLNSSSKINIDALITRRAEERCPDFWAWLGSTPLHCAVVSGNRTAVQTLINHGADVTHGIEAATSLFLDDVLQMLLDAPGWETRRAGMLNPFFSLTAAHPFRRILMHGRGLKQAMRRTIAVLYQHWDFLEPMTNSAHHWARWYEGKTPLQWIILQNHSQQDVDIVEELLLQARAPPERSGTSLILEGIIGCRYSPLRANTQIVPLLLKHGFSAEKMSERNMQSWHPFDLAVSSGCISLVEDFLAINPKLATKETEGGTPLHKAVLQSPEMVRLLLDHGADPTATDTSGQTPLARYIEKGLMFSQGEILPMMLELSRPDGFAVVKSKYEYRNALHLAAYRSAEKDRSGLAFHEALRAVLNTDGILDIIDVPGSDGVTALCSACYSLGYSAARILLDAGADPCVLSYPPHGQSPGIGCLELVVRRVQMKPFDFLTAEAKRKRLRSVYNLLTLLTERLKGTSLDEEWSVLHIAALIGYVEEAEKLVRDDPALTVAQDDCGFSPGALLLWSLRDAPNRGIELDPEYEARALKVMQLLTECKWKREGVYIKSDDQGDHYRIAGRDGHAIREVIPHDRTHLTQSIGRRELAYSPPGRFIPQRRSPLKDWDV